MNNQSSRLQSPSHISATLLTSFKVSSVKLKSRSSTQHQTRFKHHSTHTRTSETLKTKQAFTAFPVIAVKCTLRKPGAASQHESRTQSTWQTGTPRQISHHQTFTRTRPHHQLESSRTQSSCTVLTPMQSQGGHRDTSTS